MSAAVIQARQISRNALASGWPSHEPDANAFRLMETDYSGYQPRCVSTRLPWNPKKPDANAFRLMAAEANGGTTE